MKRPIITLEDGTEVLSTTGDVDAFEHGGGVLFRDPDRREFFWSFWSARDRGQKNYYVFTAPVPADVIEYFDPDMSELSIVSGMDERDIRRMGRSKNHDERLEIVMAIRECNGASRIDPSHEPETVSKYELAERWGKVFANKTSEVPMVEMDDFIIRETLHKDYECGCVDGTYLGRHSEYKFALCVIADFMSHHGLQNTNVFHEYEHGQLELVTWDPETFIGKAPVRRGKLPQARWRNAMKRYVTTEIRRKGIDRKAKAQKNVAKERRRAAAQIAQKNRMDRARELRRSMEEMYGSG